MGRVKKIYDFKDPKDVAKFRYKLAHSLRDFGLKEPQVEDAISDIVLKVMNGECKKQTFDQMAIDWLRQHLGHVTRGKIKHDALRAMISNYKFIARIPDRKDGITHIEKMVLAETISSLRPLKIRIIMRLKFFWGLTDLEIASLFDSSEPYINRLVNKTIRHLREKMKEDA
jgi:RNA polymerase sigma factor (sigma-70 family)